MNRRDLEELLRAQREKFVPDISDRIEEIKSMDIRKVPVTLHAKRKGAGRLWLKAVAAVCAVLLIFVPVYIVLGQPADMAVHALYIDVNPSIKVEVNRAEKVISAKLLNSDAEALLDIESLKSKKLGDALEIIIERLSDKGYFDDEDAEIILSMADDEEEALLQRYQGKVAEILAKRSLACSVVLNRITQQEQREVEEEGQNSRVTPGQLKYIKDIINKEPNADVSAIKDNLKNKDTPLLRMINAILEENSNQKLDELINLSDDEIIRKYKEIKNNTDNTNYSSGNGNNKQIEEGTNEGIGGNGN